MVLGRSQNYRNVWDPDLTSDGFQGIWRKYFRMPHCGAALLTMCYMAGFMQKRFSNGSFAPEDPADCSPNDKQKSRVCNLDGSNSVGFYEASSWEYSWFAPHDTAHLITLMGGNVSDLITSSPYHSDISNAAPGSRCDSRQLQATFIKRLGHFFDAGYFAPGNEPSFQVCSLEHLLRVGFNAETAVR